MATSKIYNVTSVFRANSKTPTVLLRSLAQGAGGTVEIEPLPGDRLHAIRLQLLNGNLKVRKERRRKRRSAYEAS